jgi:hypothetical protein
LHLPTGRRPKLSEVGEKALLEEITTMSLNFMAPISASQFGPILKKHCDKKNSLTLIKYCSKTESNYRKRLQLKTVQAEPKPRGRIDAYSTLRTPISFCAMLAYIQGIVSPELFFSSDDVSILLNGMDEKPSVITTKTALATLNSLNLSVSTCQEQNKQRVVSFNCTISGDSRLTCSVVKFADKTFVDFNGQPKIYKVDDSLYICLYPYGVGDAIVDRCVYEQCILPEVNSRRAYLNQSDPSSLSKYEYLCLACDGAAGQIDAITADLREVCVEV